MDGLSAITGALIWTLIVLLGYVGFVGARDWLDGRIRRRVGDCESYVRKETYRQAETINMVRGQLDDLELAFKKHTQSGA